MQQKVTSKYTDNPKYRRKIKTHSPRVLTIHDIMAKQSSSRHDPSGDLHDVVNLHNTMENKMKLKQKSPNESKNKNKRQRRSKLVYSSSSSENDETVEDASSMDEKDQDKANLSSTTASKTATSKLKTSRPPLSTLGLNEPSPFERTHPPKQNPKEPKPPYPKRMNLPPRYGTAGRTPPVKGSSLDSLFGSTDESEVDDTVETAYLRQAKTNKERRVKMEEEEEVEEEEVSRNAAFSSPSPLELQVSYWYRFIIRTYISL